MSASGLARWLQDRFELARGGELANVRPMEGLRGFAVLLVFFVHYQSLSQPWHQNHGMAGLLLGQLHHVGHAGVDLFFVLSGYLIYGTLIDRQQSFWPYMGRRVRRIYPTFLAVLAVYLLIFALRPALSKLPAQVPEAALYILQNLLLLPGLLPITPIIVVAWSLSYEMFFYIVMPLVIAACGLRSRSSGGRVVFFVGMLGVGLVLAALAPSPVPVRLGLFIAGVILYELLRRPPAQPLSPLWAVVALAAVAAVMLMPMPGTARQALRMAVLGLAFGLLCFVCFAQPQGLAGRLFGWLPLRWLGNMSYSYYLIHGLALHLFFAVALKLKPPPDEGLWALLLLLPAFAWTLGVSAVLFLCCELPLSLRRGHRGAGQRLAGTA